MPGASGASSAPAAVAATRRPSTRSIASRGTPPGRSSVGSPRQDTMVDFDADRAGAGVDDQIDAAAQIGEHMRGAGRRNVAGAVGRWRHHRPAEGRQQRARDRVRRHAHGDAVEPGEREIGRPGSPAASAAPGSAAPARTPRQASRPPRRSGRGRRAAATSATCAISGLNAGPALGGIEPRHRLAIAGVGAEPVDGLGRERRPARRRRGSAPPPRSSSRHRPS